MLHAPQHAFVPLHGPPIEQLPPHFYPAPPPPLIYPAWIPPPTTQRAELQPQSDAQQPPREDRQAIAEYVLWDDLQSLPAAFAMLYASVAARPLLFVDCEGDNLGQEGGALSLLTVRTSKPVPTTFVFDIIALARGNGALSPLFALLQDPGVAKVFFDGRMDWSELHHGWGVDVAGVLDLQLADVASRASRGETHRAQLGRLSLYLRGIPQRAPFTQVHRISSLGGCAQEHRIARFVKDMVSHDEWMQRPLSARQLAYAANDVVLIEQIHAHFEAEGFLQPSLAEQSTRYVRMWHAARTTPKNVFQNHGLLPLGILVTGDAFKCALCCRMLPRSAFTNVVKWEGANQCLVCCAVTNRLKTRADDTHHYIAGSVA